MKCESGTHMCNSQCHNSHPHLRMNGCSLPATNCQAICLRELHSQGFCEKVSLVKGGLDVHNPVSASTLDTNMQSKPVALHNKRLGTGCKTWRISSGEDLCSTIVFKDCANHGDSIPIGQVELGTDFAQQCANMHQTMHCCRKSNAPTFLSGKGNAFLSHGAPK